MFLRQHSEENNEKIKLPSLPKSQLWLIERMRALGYKADLRGMCFGVAHMALQAIMVNQPRRFYKRLLIIHAIPTETFAAHIARLSQKRIDIIRTVKAEYQPIFELLNLDTIAREYGVCKEIIAMKNKFSMTDQTANDFEKRKKEFLNHLFLQKQIERVLNQLPENEILALEIPNLFDGIEIYHRAKFYPHLFPKSKQPCTQEAILSRVLTLSLELELQGSYIQTESCFTGAYTTEDLTKYFDCLGLILKSSDPPIIRPIIFALSTSSHIILVNYDPKRSHAWSLINANRLKIMLRRVASSEHIANLVMNALSNNSITAFCTKIYSHPSNQTRLNTIKHALENQEVWNEIHSFSEQKIGLFDSNLNTWFFMAARAGRLDTLTQILKYPVNINAKCKSGTALSIAITLGFRDIVEALLKHGADANDIILDVTMLCIAAFMGYIDIAKLLLQYNAKINALSNEISPLCIAVQQGNLELVQLFLKYDANINTKYANDTTALDLAEQENHPEIVDLLLEYGATTNSIANKKSSYYQKNQTLTFFDSNVATSEFTEKYPSTGIKLRYTKKI